VPVSSTVNIETPEFMESEEGEGITEPPFSPRIESVWRGLIIMKDVTTFTVSAEEVTFNEIFLFTDRTKRESKFQRSFCFILCVGLSNIQCCGSGAFLTPPPSGVSSHTTKKKPPTPPPPPPPPDPIAKASLAGVQYRTKKGYMIRDPG